MTHPDVLLYELAARAQRKAVRRRRRQRRLDGAAHDVTPGDTRLSPSQRQGRDAEQRVAHWLTRQGMHMLAGNLRVRTGEIDLVADDHGTLVFVEVRARRSRSHGGAAASVNRRKQQRLIRAAQSLLPGLCRRHYAGRQPACRFDVVAIDGAAMQWLRQAFLLP